MRHLHETCPENFGKQEVKYLRGLEMRVEGVPFPSPTYRVEAATKILELLMHEEVLFPQILRYLAEVQVSQRVTKAYNPKKRAREAGRAARYIKLTESGKARYDRIRTRNDSSPRANKGRKYWFGFVH